MADAIDQATGLPMDTPVMVSKAAQSVFSPTVPQTGLTGAGTVTPIVHGIEGAGIGLLGWHDPMALAGVLGGIGAVGGAYSRPGLRAMALQSSTDGRSDP
jgi:hypothetical protein